MSDPMNIADIQARLDGSPFSRLLGLRVTATDPAQSTAEFAMDLKPDFQRRDGTGQWHGGVIATLIDIAGDFAVALNAGGPVPTINFRVDYLRPATGARLVASARVRRAGRSVAIVDIDVADAEGRIVAVGRGCYGTQPG